MTLDWRTHISTDPRILLGKPVVRNTRIPVDLILEKLAAGDKSEDILEAYPTLTKEDIISCLLFAAETVRIFSKLHMRLPNRDPEKEKDNADQ